MRIFIASSLAAVLLSGCASDGYNDRPNSGWSQYDYNRPDPSYNGYYADRYYRDSSRYHERDLSQNDRVYRGQDGRYYCRRSDGTTGLVVGAIAGGVLGNVIAPGGSETLGTILGAGAGALAGRAIDRGGKTKCR
ncbi:MAG: glycine zipper 2TM domain-containing protein [Sphingobium sp.]